MGDHGYDQQVYKLPTSVSGCKSLNYLLQIATSINYCARPIDRNVVSIFVQVSDHCNVSTLDMMTSMQASINYLVLMSDLNVSKLLTQSSRVLKARHHTEHTHVKYYTQPPTIVLIRCATRISGPLTVMGISRVKWLSYASFKPHQRLSSQSLNQNNRPQA